MTSFRHTTISDARPPAVASPAHGLARHGPRAERRPRPRRSHPRRHGRLPVQHHHPRESRMHSLNHNAYAHAVAADRLRAVPRGVARTRRHRPPPDTRARRLRRRARRRPAGLRVRPPRRGVGPRTTGSGQRGTPCRCQAGGPPGPRYPGRPVQTARLEDREPFITADGSLDPRAGRRPDRQRRQPVARRGDRAARRRHDRALPPHLRGDLPVHPGHGTHAARRATRAPCGPATRS